MKNIKRNHCILILFFICAGFIIQSCKSNRSSSNNIENKNAWTSQNPLSVPLKIRQEVYKKGNLVKNPSFEKATIDKKGNDSIINHFQLENWKVIGKDVQLVDTRRDSIYDSTQVASGIHAIKIKRSEKSIADIGNQSEGVMSDFIKVIPANYDFTFNIKLKNIIPTHFRNRTQARVGDNIDIHFVFYDKNKKEISPGIYSTIAHRKVKVSNQTFGFRNYFYIKDFKWAKVVGKTWVYPFSYGDIPDGCSYIKIFLGLKCSGTMWVDDIDFHLSRWSFTPLERLDSMFNKTYDLTDLLIPTPKNISNKSHISLKDKSITLVYNGNNTPESKQALSLLKQKLGGVAKVSVSKAVLPKSDNIQIILVNPKDNTNNTFKNAYAAIKAKPQGYFIRKKGTNIYFGANQPQGLYYAACTFSQLIDSTNHRIDYADITDYPSFTGRSSILLQYSNKWTLEQDTSLTDSVINARLAKRDTALIKQLKTIDFYAFYKINQLYFPYFNLSARWWKPGNFYKKFITAVGNKCTQYGNIIEPAMQINPYLHLSSQHQADKLNDSLRQLFSHADGLQMIENTIKPALDAGAKTVMLCADDNVPYIGEFGEQHVLFNKKDKAKFINLAEAQDYILNGLKLWLDKNYGNIRLEFVPPTYAGLFVKYTRGGARRYYKNLDNHLDSSVVLVWTGTTIRSLSYDLADIRRCEAVYGKEPMIWDNTPYARTVNWVYGGYPYNYPYKSVLCNIFEPFDITYPKNFAQYVNKHYYSNLGGTSEIDKIKYLSFADFTWNPNAYNPDFSLFKSLVKYAGGQKNAKLLLAFNDAYFKYVTQWAIMRMEYAKDSSVNDIAQIKADAAEKMKIMQATFKALSPIKNEDLKKELKSRMEAKIKAFNKLYDKITDKKDKAKNAKKVS